jgi:hypothetical protein
MICRHSACGAQYIIGRDPALLAGQFVAPSLTATGTRCTSRELKKSSNLKRRLSMRAVLAGAALAAFVITPSLADYYIVSAFGRRRKAECALSKNAEKAERLVARLSLRSVELARRGDR